MPIGGRPRGFGRTTARLEQRGVDPMMLDLTEADARMLRELLQDYLPELKREVARTDVKTLRHELVQRQELCERLLDRLASVAA
jgi:hypothetical protein